MFFRRLQGLFAAKIRCENGENTVRKRRNCGAIAAVSMCYSGVCKVYLR